MVNLGANHELGGRARFNIQGLALTIGQHV